MFNTRCFFSFLYFFIHRDVSELPRPIDMKLGHIMGSIFSFVIIIISLFWKHRTRQCQKIQKNSMNNKNIMFFLGSERPRRHLQLPI